MSVTPSVKTTLLLSAILCPLFCLAQIEATGLHFRAEIMTITNIILLVTSLICIRQFFWPGDADYTPFHLIHIVLILIFYSIGLYFLISNRHEYIGFEQLSPAGVIRKFFFSPDIDSFKQWVIVFAFIINICYIIRKSRSII